MLYNNSPKDTPCRSTLARQMNNMGLNYGQNSSRYDQMVNSKDGLGPSMSARDKNYDGQAMQAASQNPNTGTAHPSGL